MTYDEALAFWYDRIDFERRAAQPGDLKLDRMRALLARLGDPQDAFGVVHIAGSKGKGSTAAMLESVLRHAGHRTGLFTSPHLVDVRERIQVDAEMIGRDEVAALMVELRPHVEAMEREGQPPTFFEVGTTLGFLYFQRRGVKIAVVEVGLGGRFDSTNVVDPLVSVITSISYDHTAILGDTLEKIAFEKAGIIKPGRPVVSGVTAPEARAVIERVAAERGAPLVQLGVDFRFEIARPVRTPVRPVYFLHRYVTVQTPTQKWLLQIALPGDHQRANAALVVAVAEQLLSQDVAIPEKAVKHGLAHVHWPARCEVFDSRPTTLLDCAHNVASAEALAETIDDSCLPEHRVLIFAASNDKDVPGMFRVLAPHFRHFYLTTFGRHSRAVPPERMAEWLPADTPRSLHPTSADAWQAACTEATDDTLVVIAGSVFLAGELRPILLAAQHD
jgi:dihydrofolate synthase/folylpolyglutamate synthase